MSYNCDDVTCITCDARMEIAEVRWLYAKYKDKLPEDNFLGDLYKKLPPETKQDPKLQKAIAALAKHDPETAAALAEPAEASTVELTKLNWHGEGSGWAFEDILLNGIVPCIHGTIEAVLVWEGGDSTTGLCIEDGKYEEMDVEFKLVPKKQKKAVSR